MTFSQLQISTAFSLLSSTISIDALINRAKSLQYKALAITDRNNLYGVLPFYEACKRENIKPIIGLTADIERVDGHVHSIVLLAKNQQGYQNLLMISTEILTSHQKVLTGERLQEFGDNLIAITPGIEGEIEQSMLVDDHQSAYDAFLFYKEIFKDSFYLSLQPNQAELNNKLKDFSKEHQIQNVISSDVRYLDESDYETYRCLTAIRDGVKLKEIDEEVFLVGTNFKAADEIIQAFADDQDAIEQTNQIVEQCNVEIETGKLYLPTYPLKEGLQTKEVLKRLCLRGLKEKNRLDQEEYQERLKYELTIIEQMGFNDYFLIVADFMNYAKSKQILTGPGRGSAAGSLVAYVLGITDVDPIQYGLLFERFLNPERVSMPDIDIDFPDHRRDEVIEYVVDKYGKEKVAQIITFGTFGARAALRDTARVYGLMPQEIDRLAKMLPSMHDLTLRAAYKQSQGLQQFVQASELNKQMFKTALLIEGLPRHTSTHAAGVIISSQPLMHYTALQGSEEDPCYLTQFPMEDLEKIGLLKIDFLGLRNLSMIERMTESIRKATGKKIAIREIPFDDEKTLQVLRAGDTTGIFQLESDGMRRVLRELGPTNFEDIVAVNALYRPGPMEQIPEYIERKHGKKEISYLHPDLQQILQVTYGVIVYQEQIMQIASLMAGFTLGEADLLRRAVSKKKREVLDEERQHFVHGALQKGYDHQTANETYDLIVRFADYGFNRSHAVAYSVISWQLAYLKANYPLHFAATLLTSVIGNDEKIAKYIAETKNKGFQILPPSINKSHYPFLVEENSIRFSLGAIKGIGKAILQEIVTERQNGLYKDLNDFCLRVSSRVGNRKILANLIYAGAFDELGPNRASLLATIDTALKNREVLKANDSLFSEDELRAFSLKQMEIEEMHIGEKLNQEKEVTGVYLSNHPVEIYDAFFRQYSIIPIVDAASNHQVTIGAYMISVKRIRTKKGDEMAFIQMSDPTGEIDGVIFPREYTRYLPVIREGEVLLIQGKVESRQDRLQVIVQSIQQAKKTDENKQMLYLKVETRQHTKENLNKLHEIIRENPGGTPVVVHYEKTKQTFKLPKENSIFVNEESLHALKSLLNEPCVILK